MSSVSPDRDRNIQGATSSTILIDNNKRLIFLIYSVGAYYLFRRSESGTLYTIVLKNIVTFMIRRYNISTNI